MADAQGYAAAAAKLLDEAAAGDSGELRDLVLRHLAVMQGIGWAVLAVHDQLADAAGQVHAVADQVGDLAVPADRLADAAERLARRPWRSRRGREPEPRRCHLCKAAESDTELERAGGGTWRCIRSGDCLSRDRARRDPGAVVLPAGAVQTVRQALADAIMLRSVDDLDHAGDAAACVAEGYVSLLARLGGDLR